MRQNKMTINKGQKGQAVVEFAIFGSIILLGFGVLLSHIQRSNDQQYLQMEAFRQAQNKACTYLPSNDGAGASVQMTIIQNRRYADISNDFAKGSPQTVSANSSVLWAIPEVADSDDDEGDHESADLVVYRINDNEKVANYRSYVPYKKRDDWYFTIEDTTTDTETEYNGTVEKQEDKAGITNRRSAELKDTVHTNMTFTIREKDSGGGNDENDKILDSGKFWDITQGGYRDASGQYRYSTSNLGKRVDRERSWRTEF